MRNRPDRLVLGRSGTRPLSELKVATLVLQAGMDMPHKSHQERESPIVSIMRRMASGTVLKVCSLDIPDGRMITSRAFDERRTTLKREAWWPL